MCVLVLSHSMAALDQGRLANLSGRISQLIDGARVERRAVAYMQHRHGLGLSGLGVRIGRYEPIFLMRDAKEHLPSGLADFIARHAAESIDLAGIAARSQFDRLRDLFERSGYQTNLNADTTLLVAEAPDLTQPF